MGWRITAFGLLLASLSWRTGASALDEHSRQQARQVQELSAQLVDKDAAVRRRVVKDLAEIGNRDAWDLVIGALADPKGEVADEAQFVLAGLDDERALRNLLGKAGVGSKDALVTQRAAEVLGRLACGLDAKELLGKLTQRDVQLSEMLLWSIERLALQGKLAGDLERCGRELSKLAKSGGDARVRAQAVCALAAVAPGELTPLLPKLLGEKAHELRCAALEASLRVTPESALETGARLLNDEHTGVRLAALDAVAAAGNKRALTLLVDRIEIEQRFRLQVACVEHLQQLSGRKHKLDPRPWRLWISSLPDDWTVADRVPHSGEVGDTASLAGLPILSDRVSFLIDFSGSLWYEREGRPPRKTRVDELMRAALSRLDANTEFNLIPYTGTPHPWRDSIVPATEKNVRQALADFEANTENGSGNVFDAALLALTDPKADRIVILTDGAPTGGARWKLDLMMPLLLQAARFDRVTYDAIVIDANPGLRKRWFALAEATGGRAIAVEL